MASDWSNESMDVEGRLDRLRARGLGGSILVVTTIKNIRYLTGFTGSAGVLVVRSDDAVFITDGRYGDQARQQLAQYGVSASIEVRLSIDSQRDLLTETVKAAATVGIESEQVSWANQRVYAERFAGDLVPTAGLVEALRAVKDAGEVARIEAAAQIADAAMASLQDELASGWTERDFAIELDHRIRLLGAAGPSFETIIASGPNSAMPHHRPTDRRIGDGDLVVCDFGALVDGYASDMTRTFIVGDASPEQSRMLEVVAAAQRAGVAAVAAGVPTATVDAACRAVIDEAGLGERFNHGTGHGVGLDIHEHPFIGRTTPAVLEAGNVVTVEPGVYISGLGGVRVEDSVLVTSTGCRPLTLHPKDPTCLPSPRTS